MNALLLQQQSDLKTRMRTLLDGAAGDLSADDASQFDRMKEELTGLEKRIEREVWLDEADRRASGHSLGDTKFDQQLDHFSLRRAIAGQAGLDVDDSIEREMSKELSRRLGVQGRGILVPLRVFQQRVVTTALPAGGPGGNILPQDYRPEEFVDILRAKLVTARLGARVLTGLEGNVDIPALGTSAGAAWVAENAAITATDAAFVQVQLRPKHVGTISEYSRNLLLQSSPDIETLLRNDFAASIAVAIDTAAIGGGGANQPQGIAARITETDATTGGITWARVIGVMTTVEAANANVDNGAYLMTPGVKGLAMTKVKVTGNTDSTMIMDSPTMLAGYPAESSNCCPANSLYFGAWAELLLGYWSVFDFLVNPYETSAYSKGNVLVRGMATCDVNVRHAASFAGVNNITS